jgi:hypothetical protein
MVVMIIGKGSARVPTSDTVIKPAAQIIAMTQPEFEQALRIAFTG